ncbi:MAG: hypothetical protein NC213_05985 [Acetobacter sp.]|nr:hypothetical protein [Bacteroides sp.]MCM1341275.1 hypothetical protein [Acetobacter sp.]MCM1433949.1 hypothetical protein [Clostridiales bacterium]
MRKEDIKNCIDNIEPDLYMQTRIKAGMPDGKKKINMLKPIVSCCMAFLLITGGVFGISYKSNNENNILTENKSSSISSVKSEKKASYEGGVIIAYAYDNEQSYTKAMYKTLNTSVPAMYKIGVIDLKGKTEEESEQLIKEDREKNRLIEGEINGEPVYFMTTNRQKLFPNICINQYSCGVFDLNIKNYQQVKEIRVYNESEYGEIKIMSMDLNFNDDGTRKNDGIDYTKGIYISNYELPYASLSGERYIKDINLTKKLNTRIFGISWTMSGSLYDVLNNNPNMDLSEITDVMTIVVEFKDGSQAKSMVDISFDKEGFMYAENTSFDYVNSGK